AASLLPAGARALEASSDRAVMATLGEEHCGSERWRLSRATRLYYQLKPLVPNKLGVALRRRYRRHQESRFSLAWPIEDRYVRFHYCCVTHVLCQRGLDSAPFVSLWPGGQRFALVLTHDVERGQGHAFVGHVAD